MTWLGWTDDNARLAVDLYRDGKTASQIMQEIGAPSRNIVCGKLDRMGMTRKDAPKPAPKPKTSVAKVAARKPPAAKPPKRRSPVPMPPDPTPLREVQEAARPDERVIEPADAPRGAAEAHLALRDRQCRWPLGDPHGPDFHFCAAPVDDRERYAPSYCGAHSRLATSRAHT